MDDSFLYIGSPRLEDFRAKCKPPFLTCSLGRGTPQIIFRNDHLSMRILIRLEQDSQSCGIKFKRKQGSREQPGKIRTVGGGRGREEEGARRQWVKLSIIIVFITKHFFQMKSKGKPQYRRLIK